MSASRQQGGDVERRKAVTDEGTVCFLTPVMRTAAGIRLDRQYTIS